MKLKHLDFFHKTLRKYRRLQARLAEMNSPHLFRKLDMLRRRLLRLNRAWKLGLSMAALLAGMTGTTQAQTFPATITIDTLSQNMGMVLIGENEYDSFGQSVHGAGDFNGDGIDDIIVGSTEFALRMCADKDYQKVLGNSVESCNANVSSSKNTCASYLRKDSKKFYKDKHEVKRLTEQFIKCVSH